MCAVSFPESPATEAPSARSSVKPTLKRRNQNKIRSVLILPRYSFTFANRHSISRTPLTYGDLVLVPQITVLSWTPICMSMSNKRHINQSKGLHLIEKARANMKYFFLDIISHHCFNLKKLVHYVSRKNGTVPLPSRLGCRVNCFVSKTETLCGT